jgi:glycosyltransferase involved in cell wall biosynthesis
VRVVLVHPYPWPEVRRGAERYLEDLSGYLAGRGHDVTVVTGTHDGPGRWRSDAGALMVRRRHLPGAARLGLSEVETFGLCALPPLAAAGADVVHAFVPSAALAGRLAGRPTLYSVLGHPAADQLPPRRLPRLLFLQASRRATAVATLSRASADAMARLVGRRPHVLPPGVRLEQFPCDLAPRRGPPTILLSASLADPRKRASLVVEAFGHLLRRRPDARLVLSGEGDPAPLLAGAGLGSAVEAAGPGDPEEVPARYRRATVTVLAAAHEAFGLALVESLASGTPVVCTPDGGMPEIVDPGVGRVARAATPEDLGQALESAIDLAADPSTARRCLARARRWDWHQAVGPAHLALYASLAAGDAAVAVS